MPAIFARERREKTRKDSEAIADEFSSEFFASFRAFRGRPGRAGILPAVPGFQPGTSGVCARATPGDVRRVTGRMPGTAGKIPALPDARRSPFLTSLEVGTLFHSPKSLVALRRRTRNSTNF